ncbi:Protein kinase domain-containing protein [Entamoeba marina]
MSLFRPLTSSSKIPFRPVRVCLIKQLSINLLQTINICNRPHFIPVLTIPGEAVFNNGLDNINYDLIVKAGDTIGSSTSIEGVKYSMNPFTITKYKILGNIINNVEVAVKILRNKEPYFKQGLIELSAVELLNKYFDPSPNNLIDKNPIKIVQSDTQSVNTFKQTLYDFVKRCLEFDPKDRITPQQALEHPFIKGNSMNNWWLPQREVPYRVLDKGLTLNEKQTQELLRLELNPNPDLKVIFEIFNKAIKKEKC